MITWMQKHRKYLVITIWISTIAFVGAGFVGWGAYSYNTSRAGAVAVVGNTKITLQELNRAYTNIYNYYQDKSNGKFSREQAKKMGLKDIALNHHEKWDGSGYPGFIDDLNSATPKDISQKPKKGEEIPIFGRVVAIADVLDALVSKRVYKPAWSFEDAIKEINRCSGTQFDPELVNALNLSKDKVENVYKYYQE